MEKINYADLDAQRRAHNAFIDKLVDINYEELENLDDNQQEYLDKWSKIEGVQYMGFVDDLQLEYLQAQVVVVPIYGGAGTNIKVLEAMQMRRPCVTTSYGVRGFSEYFEDNKEILIAENDTAFADNVVSLLKDEKKNHTIATNAYTAMTAHFSRKAFNEIVKNTFGKLC